MSGRGRLVERVQLNVLKRKWVHDHQAKVWNVANS
jgi:hypothetical protein